MSQIPFSLWREIGLGSQMFFDIFARMQNRLWLDLDTRREILSAYQNKESWIVPLARCIFETPSDETSDAVIRIALRTLLTDASSLPIEAINVWTQIAKDSVNLEDLGKAHVAMTGAALLDCIHGRIDASTQEGLAATIDEVLLSFFTTSAGNPHSVTNNWWAVTHSAIYCLACARQLLDVKGGGAGWKSPRDIEEWSWARLLPFLGHFGPGGAYHEGLGYMGYTCAYLLPAVHLRMLRSGNSISDIAPGLSRMASLIFCASIEGCVLSDETGSRNGWGRTLSWNDAGLGFLSGPAPLLSIALAPASERRPLRDQWDRLAGHLRPDQAVEEFASALFFHLAFYGSGAEGKTPPSLLAFDALHGFWIARNRYRDATDAVAGAYACGYRPGGHRQEDAGSIRFSALGWDWILGGGQARGQAEWQSRLVPSDVSAGKERRCGSVLHGPTGGEPVFGMDLRAVHEGYSERYTALHPSADGHLAVLDLVDDHRQDRRWDWCLSFSPEMKICTREDGFSISAPDGCRMDGVFLIDRPSSIDVRSMPDSQRTFANGQTKKYPGRPFLLAHFDGPLLNIFVSLKVTAGDERPVILQSSDRFDVQSSDGSVWERPFGTVLPPTREGRLRGLCKFPLG